MNSELRLPLLAEGRKKKWAYSSLLFSLFYFTPLFFGDTYSHSQYIVVASCYVAFVGVYLATVNAPKKRIPWLLGCLFLINSIANLINIGGGVLFGYMSFILGYYYRPRISALVTVCIVLSIIVLQQVLYVGLWMFALACAVNCLALLCFGVMERRETTHLIKDKQAKEALGTLSAIAERERIGRDLHDVAGHALSGISLKAQVADKLMEKGQYEKASAEVKELARLSQSLLSEIRKTVTGIKHLSMLDEMEKAFAQLRDKQFSVEKQIDTTIIPRLTALQETNITLIIKECVTNVLRHSKGNKVIVALLDEGENGSMIVQDNGQNVANTSTTNIVKGNGLTGIEERAALINATVSIQSNDGLRIALRFPLSKSAHILDKEIR
ncbi:sensor histidine kinase [Agaribacter flavus]|uniref:Sensor histidine kinase n=1 Tax=Agaribacter flavus TaxID=1902781 RepID=A0ABV7FV54_9ALTE